MKVEISSITKKFANKHVLNGVNIVAEEGSCVGLLGVNGSGKSTLLNILAGISSCNAGSFCCDGLDFFKCSKKDRRIIGYVPQTPPLIEELSCMDNLRLWYSSAQIKEELNGGVLKMLGIDEFLKTTVSKMSGGMKKRLAIACAVAHNPKILIMDEPTAALDMLCKRTVAQYIQDFKSKGGIVIVSTHDYSELDVCDRMYILKDGLTSEYTFDGDVEKLVRCLKND